MEENKVPIGVWVFWVVIGLSLLGVVGSRYPTFGSALTFLVTILSAIGGAVGGIAAYMAVRELRKDREEERTYRRPFFSVINGEMGEVWLGEDECGEFIKISCRQVGMNPATDLKAYIEFINRFGDGGRESISHESVDDYASQADFVLTQGGHFLGNLNHSCYVICKLQYRDAVHQIPYEQTFYFQWPGFFPSDDPNDKTRSLHPMSKQALRWINKKSE